MSDPNPNTDPGTDPKDQDPGRTDPPENDPPENDPDDDDDPEEWTPPSKEQWEKLDRAAKRRDAALRKAQQEIADLKKGSKKDGDPDPAADRAARADMRLVRAETRTALTAVGVTDREDQKRVLDALNLTGIEVDEEDGPDPDQVADLIEVLRKAFGGKGGSNGKDRPRTPRIDTRDRGGAKADPADPDKARYAKILGQR